MRRLTVVLPLLLVVLLVSRTGLCQSAADRETLFQVATIDSLLQGVYDGFYPCALLPGHGDLGLGTFASLDGEMVVLDGVVYQVLADGSVRTAPEGESTPFACVTFFEPDFPLAAQDVRDYAHLRQVLDAMVAEAPNMFHAFKATGRFTRVHTRSVERQERPWPPLAVAVRDQPEFTFENVHGDVVGFYCPEFVKGINVPGWHLHFLTQERDGGGHVLDLAWTAGEVAAALDATPGFRLLLPPAPAFQDAVLGPDRQEALHRVEQKSAKE